MEDGKHVPSWNESIREAAEAVIRRTRQVEGIEGTPTFSETMRSLGYFFASVEMELERLPLDRKENRPKLRIVR